MKTILKIVTFFAFALLLMSCEDMFEPKNENNSDFNRVYKDPGFAEGLLASAYARVPYLSLERGNEATVTISDVATDDAVTNDLQSVYLGMATGSWSAISNPLNIWNDCNAAMIYLDQFMSIIDTVQWKPSNQEISALFVDRFKGEAYGLKGVIQYHLLQTTAGYDDSGQLVGTPFYTDDRNFNIPRSSFAESVAQINSDFDKALEYLITDDYKNATSASELPAKYAGVDINNYNLVFGNLMNQRLSGRIVKAYKARLALLEASPAFSPDWESNTALWAKAANYAGEVLQTIDGISGLDSNGHKFYHQSAGVDNISLASGLDSKETIWRRQHSTTITREKLCFPPSMYGNGRINPTQNLVDAFPMANGKPISDATSGYDASKPYNNRDPRLSLYIAYDGGKIGSNTIATRMGGGPDAKGAGVNATRTGYYLKKMLREDAIANPAGTQAKRHFETYMRYTEIFLTYAEAANEAWGPDGKGSFSFSAKDVIGAIRQRAGITNDSYLPLVTTKTQMRELIRNERRIELCFEGSRFWDLRRWKANLTEPAKGIDINNDGSIAGIVTVEERKYDNDYMHYGPLPESEVVKFSALEQNKGW